MIVTCPGCDSNYRVPNEKVPKGGARMRCPQCDTEFLAMLPDDDGAAPPPPPKPRIPPPAAAAPPSSTPPPLPQASARASSPGFAIPTTGPAPVTAPRPNPFAKPAASPPPVAPPPAAPPSTAPPFPPPPAAQAAPPPPAAQPATVFGEASMDLGGAPVLSPLPQGGAPPPAPAAPAPPSPPLGMAPPQPVPPTPPQPAPAYSPPPAPTPAPAVDGAGPFAPGPPPPAPAIAASPAPPAPPPAASASPSPPPPAPAPSPALGDGVLDFDPLADDLFSASQEAAIPREVTGIFPVPNLGGAPAAPPAPPPEAMASASPPPPAPSLPVAAAPDPASQPNAAPPAAPPASPFGGASFPSGGFPTPPQFAAPQGGQGPGMPIDTPSSLTGAESPQATGAAPFGAESASEEWPFGEGMQPAGGGAGDVGAAAADDDPFAAIFDANFDAPPPSADPTAPPAQPSEPAPPDDDAKAGMKAVLSRAMDAKNRAAALKEEHSPTSRGGTAPLFSADDPSESAPLDDDPPPAPVAAPPSPPPAAPAPPAPAADVAPPKPAAKAPRRGMPRALKEGAAWGALLASAVVCMSGLVFTAWTTQLVPLDDVLMPHAERHLGVRPPWSHVGLDDEPLATLEKAAERAREGRDLALEAAAWRRVLVVAPEHEEARRRLRKILSLLGDPRSLEGEVRAQSGAGSD